ncbi:MAG TPA: hypothetical protein VGD74_04840 [Vulgatibacter sp.]
MRTILHRFLIASLAAAAIWACGGDGSSGGGTGGTGGGDGGGGTGGDVTAAKGTCGNPIDFFAVKVHDNKNSDYILGKVDEGESVYQGKCGGKGKEVVFRYTAPTDGVITYFGIEEGDDIVAYTRSVCDSPDDELVCVGEVGKGKGKPIGKMKAGDTIYLLVDSSSDAASDYKVKVHFSPILNEGDDCRPDGLTGACVGVGLVCSPFEGMCMTNTVPEVTSARVLKTPTDAFHVEVNGKDAEGNAMFWYGRFLNAQGEVVPGVLNDGSGEGVVTFQAPIFGKRTFKGTLTTGPGFFATFPTVVAVEIGLVDFDEVLEELLLTSELTRVPVEEGSP